MYRSASTRGTALALIGFALLAEACGSPEATALDDTQDARDTAPLTTPSPQLGPIAWTLPSPDTDGPIDTDETDLPPATWTDVAVGSGYSCGLTSEGRVRCWGTDGASAVAGRVADTPVDAGYEQFDASNDGGCALPSDGLPICWGHAGLTTGVATEPLATIVVGDGYACGLRASDASVLCWGSPPGTAPSGPFIALSAGGGMTCALRATGVAECWGWPDPPMDAPTGVTFTSLDVGRYFACGLLTTGGALCWGDELEFTAPPAEAVAPPIAAGHQMACAMDNTAHTVCWGRPSGWGPSAAHASDLIAMDIAAGHGCAVNSAGQMTCWGMNDYGEATPPSP